MRLLAIAGTMAIISSAFIPHGKAALPIASPNENEESGGSIRGGVLHIALEAKLTMWHPDGDSLPGIPIEAFAEPGRAPLVPGPLVRVRAGTPVRATIRNSLDDTLTFLFPRGERADSIVIAPGHVRELKSSTPAAGTYLYRARNSTRTGRALGVTGLLTGAVVVDSAGTTGPARDRIFVLLAPTDSADEIFGAPFVPRTVRAINGRSWPHTPRLSATVGDTLRWRVINAANDIHPMHLHGFYFRVDEFNGPRVAVDGQGAPGRMVVTERLSQFATMSITWIPERAGNWMFHCHFQDHVAPHGPLGQPGPDGKIMRIGVRPAVVAHDSHANHALTAMAGLAVGIHVASRSVDVPVEAQRSPRELRLIAVQDSGFPVSRPSMRFVIQDRATGRNHDSGPGSSPPLYLERDEPVAITVVNNLREPTSVHWHGIELDSYFDGVAGFSGAGTRLAPTIAPRDSFVARFTPPRAGTFIYHSHMEEPRHHRAGMVGALIVRDSKERKTAEDIVVLMKSARGFPLGSAPASVRAASVPFEINGRTDPDTTILLTGRRYRFRFVGLATGNPNATVWLTARVDSSLQNVNDSMVVQWTPVGKDGADLPQAERRSVLARQIVSMGETYDFEFIPSKPGNLRLEIRGNGPAGRLFVRGPIRVESSTVRR
jgi:FtsP/CotA-like multicopper oxidase with cupredoxin domain